MSEAPAGNCRGFGDEDDIKREGGRRGNWAAGISVYIKVNLFYKKRPGGRFGELVYPLFL